MPTPGGLPKAGDRIRHKDSGVTFTVVKREGNDALCSLILRRDDGKTLRSAPPYGYSQGHMRMLEATYWIGRTYEYVEKGE